MLGTPNRGRSGPETRHPPGPLARKAPFHPAHGRVSYTQFEARHARKRKIKAIYLLLAPAYPAAAGFLRW